MDNKHKITITTRDRLLRAWENSMELVTNYELYAHEISDNKAAANLFAKFAEDECIHASRLLELLHDYEER